MLYRKHLGHIAIVGLKFLLSFDNFLSDHVIMIVGLAANYIKLLLNELLFCTSSLLTKGKTTIIALKTSIASKRENEVPAFAIRLFKNNFLHKDIGQWRINKSA